ncbi:dynein light chain Tctex-type 5-like isoform X1 [Mya arenaria]|uniref:dynein light chain Tctex-type 5-like isoform X1 n=2 Tax=Mya arenaria TaxID=6604 RepID=UPI0022DFC80F|nr:dynein light chain Tctex-type 5-like isoform X1 [Mya arenaria]
MTMERTSFKGSSLQVRVVSCRTVDTPPSRDNTDHDSRMKARHMTLASPRIGRAKVLPISSARSSTAPPTLRTETATFLEVTPMDISLPTYSDHRRQIRQESKYKMAPATELPVEPRNIEIAVEKVLSDNLHDKYYEASQSRHLSQLLSARVLEEVRRQAPGNYKFVAVVSIGSVRERPGVQLGSRCLWNKDTDRFITAKYSNRSLFAVAMVYGLHYD